MLNLQVGIGDPYSNLYRVVDLALNQSRQTLVSPIFTSVGSICGFASNMYRGTNLQTCFTYGRVFAFSLSVSRLWV